MIKKKIHLIAAARPNFMKIAPLYHALKKEPWAEPIIIHTGQHYDINMSDAFFKDLKLPEPHHHLGIGSGSHAEQTGQVMIAHEKLLQETRPDIVVVVGDVNSTVACTLAAVKIKYGYSSNTQSANRNSKLDRPIVAHLEAGLRSFDRTMPEEINRIVTDSIADILWTPSPDADENLLREGIPKEKIERVGNIMIDSLEMMRPKIEKQNARKKYDLGKGSYGLVTLHRPSNVDDPDKLKEICNALKNISEKLPLIFPVHPRTHKNLNLNGLWKDLSIAENLYLDEPIPYIQFMSLVFDSKILITDSGGIQEETTYLGIPCLTMRPNTERPVTISQGTNRLGKVDDLSPFLDKALSDGVEKCAVPELWDGKAALRIKGSIARFFDS
jgi:UDP-N-acetylglucosamine 2-epimerase (non-hydrolysing)